MMKEPPVSMDLEIFLAIVFRVSQEMELLAIAVCTLSLLLL